MHSESLVAMCSDLVFQCLRKMKALTSQTELCVYKDSQGKSPKPTESELLYHTYTQVQHSGVLSGGCHC